MLLNFARNSSTDDEQSEPKSTSGEEETETEVNSIPVTLQKLAKDKTDKKSLTDAQKVTKDVYIPKFEIYKRMVARKDDPWHEQVSGKIDV